MFSYKLQAIIDKARSRSQSFNVFSFPFVDCSKNVEARLHGTDIYFFAQWTVSGDTLSFRVSANTDGWIGIGFSVDELMVYNNVCHTTYLRGYNINSLKLLFTAQFRTDCGWSW